MDHLIFLEEAWKEIEALVSGIKTMIIQGFDEINVPHRIITEGDVLYFAYNNGKDEIRARGVVDYVSYSHRLSTEESYEMIIRNQGRLMLPDELFYKWAGKKYLVLIGLKNIEAIGPFAEHEIIRRQISA